MITDNEHKGWCNRHQKYYNFSDCLISSRGYPDRMFYICPDCDSSNQTHKMTVGEQRKAMPDCIKKPKTKKRKPKKQSVMVLSPAQFGLFDSVPMTIITKNEAAIILEFIACFEMHTDRDTNINHMRLKPAFNIPMAVHPYDKSANFSLIRYKLEHFLNPKAIN